MVVKIGDQVFRAVLDTGATLSIVARRLLKTFKKTKTVAIRVGDGRTIHSLGGVDVTICLGDETVTQHCRVLDTDAFDIVIGTDFLRRNPQVKMLSLQRPPYLHCDFGSGLFSVPLELSGRKESGLRYAAKTNCRAENYSTECICCMGSIGFPTGEVDSEVDSRSTSSSNSWARKALCFSSTQLGSTGGIVLAISDIWSSASPFTASDPK